MSKSNANIVPYAQFRGALYKLVCKGLPDFCDDGGNLKVRALAERLSLSHEGVYKWFRANHLPPLRAQELVKLSKKRLELADFHKFIV